MSGTGISKSQIPVIALDHSLFQNKATKKTKGKRYTETQANDTKMTLPTLSQFPSRFPPPPLKKLITEIKSNSIRGIIIQGQVPLHSLTNIKSVKSEDRDSTLSTGIYGTGTYVCVLE